MKVYCILSDERAVHSRSPVMFSTVLRRQGINAVYVPFMVIPRNLGQAIEGLRVLNIAGANVTAPFKETVIPHLDVLSEGARIIGAINTIVRDGNSLKGYNTNAIGIMDTLRSLDYNVEEKSALVFGTGGAARTVAFILNWLRAREVWVAGRNIDRARDIVKEFNGRAIDAASLNGLRLPCALIINATSVSSPDESADLAGLAEKLDTPFCELVIDLNYGRRRNFWQEMANRKGIRFMDGLNPLAFQACRTLELWTGVKVPPQEFLDALPL